MADRQSNSRALDLSAVSPRPGPLAAGRARQPPGVARLETVAGVRVGWDSGRQAQVGQRVGREDGRQRVRVPL